MSQEESSAVVEELEKPEKPMIDLEGVDLEPEVLLYGKEWKDVL